MRWLLALLMAATILFHSTLAGAAPAPQAVNLRPTDLPAGAVIYGESYTGAPGNQGKDGFVAASDEDFCFCVGPGHGATLSPDDETGSSRVEQYSTSAAAHAHYLVLARSWQARSRPDGLPLSSRQIGDEGLSSQGNRSGARHAAYGNVVFRRGLYVVTVMLNAPTPAYPIERVFTLAKRVDGYIKGAPHGTAPTTDQSTSVPSSSVTSRAFPGVAVSARHLHADTDRRYPPKPGDQYLVAEITIVNHGTTPYYYGALQFYLRAGTGTDQYLGDGGDSNVDITWLSYIALQPGQRITGSLAFEVPKSKSAFTLYWLPEIFSTQAVQVPLGT